MEPPPPPIKSRMKWRLWFAAWGVVLLAMLVSNPKWVPAAPFFPLGLIAIFPNGTEMAVMAWMMLLPICIGWAFYALLTVVMVETWRNWLFVLTYVIFCVALALNVVGCNKTVGAVQGIH